jgi:hypothetical protein
VKKKKTARKTNSVKTPTAKEKSEVCFVIMPFGGWLDDYYETIYRPAIEAAGLEPHRADDLYRPSTIVHDIWAYTRRAKLLVADLTGKNPNVFYELGLAHALAKPAILVAESMEDIPFDLRALRIIVYEKNHPRWGELLQEKIEASIKEVLAAPQEAVLPAFLQLREATSAPKVTPREKDIIEIKQELDLLRREVHRSSIDLDGPPRHREIDADQAVDMIRSYFRRGMPPQEIVRRMEKLGPPESWIRKRITDLESERTQAKRQAAAPPSPEIVEKSDPQAKPP